MISPDRIEHERLPADLLRLCRRLREAGFQAHLVGGGVRDLLLGRQVHDWDVATSARPREVQELFRRTIPTGLEHGTVTVLVGGLVVQVTTYRGEAGYQDARHPDQVVFLDSIEADLSRRDFTINAMALEPLSRELVDPFEGALDLERKLVRAVGDARQRFAEDGLRPMRALRIAAQLEFTVDPDTLAAIPEALSGFRRVSAERVRDELLKLLCAPRPGAAVELMREAGLLAEVLPELLAARGVTQNRFHIEDVYQHSLRVCDAVRPEPILRLAALLHDVGKPLTAAPHTSREGESTFHGHEQVGARLCEEIGRRLRLSNAQRERLTLLVAHHLVRTSGWTEAGLRRYLGRLGETPLDELFELRAADLQGRPQAAERLHELEELRAQFQKLREQGSPLRVADLAVGGREVMERLGIGPGRQVGELLRALLERVLDDPSLNQRETLLGLLDEMAARR
jgi:tRNA nucleotidyltransferase (CCA-adding enzyme)